MKKAILFTMFLSFAILALFAKEKSIPINDDISLTIFPADPLLEESKAYPFSNDFLFQFFASPKDPQYIANTILVTAPNADQTSGGYREYEIVDMDLNNNIFWQLKAATNVG